VQNWVLAEPTGRSAFVAQAGIHMASPGRHRAYRYDELVSGRGGYSGWRFYRGGNHDLSDTARAAKMKPNRAHTPWNLACAAHRQYALTRRSGSAMVMRVEHCYYRFLAGGSGSKATAGSGIDCAEVAWCQQRVR